MRYHIWESFGKCIEPLKTLHRDEFISSDLIESFVKKKKKDLKRRKLWKEHSTD